MRANGFTLTIPLGLVLGVALSAVAGERVSFPLIPNAVVVGQLTPGILTLLLGWTRIDRWPTDDLALLRAGWRVNAARTAATLVVCVAASLVAGHGEGTRVAAHTSWFLAVALLLGLLVPEHWWAGVIIVQIVMLRMPMASADWDARLAHLGAASCAALAAFAAMTATDAVRDGRRLGAW